MTACVGLVDRLSRASQTYTAHVRLSDELQTSAVFYGTVVPLLAWAAVNRLLVAPYVRSRLKEEADRRRQANRDRWEWTDTDRDRTGEKGQTPTGTGEQEHQQTPTGTGEKGLAPTGTGEKGYTIHRQGQVQGRNRVVVRYGISVPCLEAPKALHPFFFCNLNHEWGGAHRLRSRVKEMLKFIPIPKMLEIYLNNDFLIINH